MNKDMAGTQKKNASLLRALVNMVELVYHSVVRDVRTKSGKTVFGIFQAVSQIGTFFVIYAAGHQGPRPTVGRTCRFDREQRIALPIDAECAVRLDNEGGAEAFEPDDHVIAIAALDLTALEP